MLNLLQKTNFMKLIADSGSTKTDWLLCENGKRVHSIETQGINPFYQSVTEVLKILNEELLPNLKNITPKEVYFYGAGCSFPEKQELVRKAFHKIFPHNVPIQVNSDLVGAARALFGNSEGIACILGTGSNSCYWDGEKIIKNVPPLGYILGDEGSGAVLGKLFIADLLKNQLPKPLCKKFFSQYNTNYEELMSKVYKQPFPNRNLAQYTYFLHENLKEETISVLIKKSFEAFVSRNLSQYPQRLSVSFVGSIAVAFESTLSEVLSEKGYTKGVILKKPIEALGKYHS